VRLRDLWIALGNKRVLVTETQLGTDIEALNRLHLEWTLAEALQETALHWDMARAHKKNEATLREAITTAGEMLRDGSGAVVGGGKPWRMWVTTSPAVEASRCSRCGFPHPRAEQAFHTASLVAKSVEYYRQQSTCTVAC
jgi:hypothetical protein